jgi:hypothetical protein
VGKFNVDEHIKALKVCKYFTIEGIENLIKRYPNEEHIKIAMQIKAKNEKPIEGAANEE